MQGSIVAHGWNAELAAAGSGWEADVGKRAATNAAPASNLSHLNSPTGTYLTEGGVHFVAALRMMAGAAGWGQATEVAACARGISDNLPHPDTLQGLVWFEGGERGQGRAAVTASLRRA